MVLSDRIMSIQPSATIELTNKMIKLKNEGAKVISFGAGEPDFNTPEVISNAAKEAIDNGFTKYTTVSGIKELKDAITFKLKRDNDIEYGNENIVVSNGAKHSLFNLFATILNPGDEVIIPVPFWVSYSEMVKLCGGKPVFVETDYKEGFKIHEDKIREKLTSKTKAILLNSPSNPTGCVMDRSELEMIANIALEKDLFIISDEIYEKLIYGKRHISIASISEEVKKRTIIINGVSKAYAMTGWRIGYMAAPPEIAKYASVLQGHTTSSPNSIAQKASVKALLMEDNELEYMVSEFVKRRDYMYNTLSEIDNFSLPPKPDGAFYTFVNIEKFGMKSLEFCDYVLKKANVGIVPGIAFGTDDFVRFSYANSFEEIKEGLDRLKSL